MNTVVKTLPYVFPINDNNRLVNLCGVLYENIRLLERHFNTRIHVKADRLHVKKIAGITDIPALDFSSIQRVIAGSFTQGRETIHAPCEKDPATTRSSAHFAKRAGIAARIKHFYCILVQLYQVSHRPIAKETIHALLQNKHSGSIMSNAIHLHRKIISPRNNKQIAYLKSIDDYDMTFAIGPAGTGKTYLAVSKALEFFSKGIVQRLVFVRPAVEAGEKLGFLPGDLVEKVLPYLRPIYDALYEMIGFKETQKLIQSDTIEVLPLAFMRGRTLNEAFIILDEAQNTTAMQMKMFLTRMGFGSKTVITGDITQIDLPRGVVSGLEHAVQILKNIDTIAIHEFTSQEVVRHPLVSQIVDCYEQFEAKEAK